ncbi:hypothetical protein A3K29_00735 [Candidatus Collierbacteria bacterium RIFOXYB2_FULL_46_14]|nr:MAG: hypothetical protein A3K29_00735 [Candidatus Collierbacteria bacterium RIFOXYB2_FULL_46_14]OGD75705.1 MAG: hypothetical protein A3K43_00735 [Candidatus Collierbacteria bacterium RIFOXYA2_FULL_46_20]OGD77041.1 MAG: hypothetical protein A3K39_00735 [Candidatus Collierbacteria bacterium RIFOXYC2_FULL_43_15]OGD80331.1 MAG: hypothetical protein A2320_01225 [Pseudomonadales bacterium GWC2_63_15]OGD81763.1 MAG: hypothetical protein A3K36_00735 [Candidatus Collierbacteria bacterium RIFOXYD2_FUL
MYEKLQKAHIVLIFIHGIKEDGGVSAGSGVDGFLYIFGQKKSEAKSFGGCRSNRNFSHSVGRSNK